MDELDKKLLQILRENARISLKTLSQKLNLSSPAVSARIERLLQKKIIRKYTVDLDPVLLGQHISAYIHLELVPDCKERFIDFVCACRNVTECSFVTGRFTILIRCSFPSMEKLDNFVDELQQFGKTEVQIVFSTPVVWRGPPI